MTVLHILLCILKILGILLLILLVLLLLILLAVLFCPVRYELHGKKEETRWGGKIGISWLCHLLSVRIWYESEKKTPDYSIRIFGISVRKVLTFFEKRREKRPEKQKKSVPDQKPGIESQTAEMKRVSAHTETEPIKKTEERSLFRKVKEAFQNMYRFVREIWNKIKKIWLTGEKICDRIEKIRNFLESEHFVKGKALICSEIKRIWQHIKPRKAKGYLKFGTEDPCMTGKILAAAGIFYPAYGEHFTVEPYFDQNILEGDIVLRGRIRGICFVVTAWRLFLDSDIRYMVKKFKQH